MKEGPAATNTSMGTREEDSEDIFVATEATNQGSDKDDVTVEKGKEVECGSAAKKFLADKDHKTFEVGKCSGPETGTPTVPREQGKDEVLKPMQTHNQGGETDALMTGLETNDSAAEKKDNMVNFYTNNDVNMMSCGENNEEMSH